MTGRKEYKGTSDKGKLVADYKFNYNKDGVLVSRHNKVNGRKKFYKYDDDGNLTKVIFTNKNGKITSTCECNPDGTYANRKTDKYFYVYEFDEGGIRTKAKKYDISSIDSNNQPKKNATPVEELTYEDGEIVSRKNNNNKTTKHYSDGKLTSKTDGKFTYVYKYDNSGNKIKTLKYYTKDCTNGIPNEGATPIPYDETGKDIINFAKKFKGYNENDGSANIFVKGVGDNARTTPWCSEFAKYVLKNSGHYNEIASWYKKLPDKYGSGKNSAQDIQKAAKKAGAIVSAKNAQPGDIVLFDYDGDGKATHTGMVVAVKNGKLYTIEGNHGGKVVMKTYDNANSKKFIYCKVTP